MKKLLNFIIVFTCIIGIGARGLSNTNDSSKQALIKNGEKTKVNIEKSLVVYFSMPEINQANNMSEQSIPFCTHWHKH